MIDGIARMKQLAYPWRIGIAFCVATLGVLTCMMWLTNQVLRLERSEAVAMQRAGIEENARLALWRIDSALSPILAQESIRPNSLPSQSPFVKLCFQFSADGELTTLPSPHVANSIEVNRNFSEIVSKERLVANLTSETTAKPTQLSPFQIPQSQTLNIDSNVSRSQVEFEQRRSNSSGILNNNLFPQGPNEPSAVPMIPVSHRGELLLVRKVSLSGKEYVQGCWLDWKAISNSMHQLIRDLLPNASLEICENAAVEDGSNLLASIPAKLNAGNLLAQPVSISSATGWLLSMTWVGVLSALAASAGLVLGSIRLAERRSSFVAAVTHELRTPLTTFLMYTEMLYQDMVPDPIAQKQYISTLRHEALRLEHLVENVLAYAKLERGRTPQPLQQISVESLLGQTLPYLKQRAAMSQMELVVLEPSRGELVVQASQGVVEQILLNLVDNSCKYAAIALDRRIQLLVEATDQIVSIGVKDFGPGLKKQGKWFRPFHKTVEEAANSAPGVGLGLSLCKRLAEQMNGSIEVDFSNCDGAYVKLMLLLCRKH